MTVGEIKGAGEETEVNIPEGLTRPGLEMILPPGRVADGLTGVEEGDWVGRLVAGSVGSTKMVVVMVTITTAGSVGSGLPSEVEEGGSSPSPL